MFLPLLISAGVRLVGAHRVAHEQAILLMKLRAMWPSFRDYHICITGRSSPCRGFNFIQVSLHGCSWGSKGKVHNDFLYLFGFLLLSAAPKCSGFSHFLRHKCPLPPPYHPGPATLLACPPIMTHLTSYLFSFPMKLPGEYVLPDLFS